MSRAWKNGSTSRWRKLREIVLKRDGCCQMCGRTDGPMHVDHIIPKRLNGTDELWNLRQLCKSCNLGRGGRFFEVDSTPATMVCIAIDRQMGATGMSDFSEILYPQSMTAKLLCNGEVIDEYKIEQCDKCSQLRRFDKFGYQKGYDKHEKIIWFCGDCR